MSRGEERRQARDGGSDMKKLYIVLAAVAVIGIGAVGYSVRAAGGGAVSAPIEIEGLIVGEGDSARLDLSRLVELAQGVTKGDPNAAVTIIEFGDYQCPSCQMFATQVEPQMELGLIQTGKAKFVYYDWPIIEAHAHAFLAARAARCAGDQGKYWEYHDHLYRNQARWAAEPSAEDTFIGYATDLGLDRGGFETCLLSDRHAEVVTANMELGMQLGVRGTPTIIVEHGGVPRNLNNLDYQSLREYVEELLAPAGGA
jgi:protein-disulfide isomerase